MSQSVRGVLSRQEIIQRLDLIEDEGLLYAEILDYLSNYQNVFRVSIMRPDQDNCLRVVAARGISTRAWQTVSLKIGQGLAGYVWKNGQDIFVENTAACPDYQKFYPPDKKNIPAEKIWVWPIKFQNSVLAIINLHGVAPADIADMPLLSRLWGLALKRIQQQLNYDALTGLWRRELGQKKLEEMLERAIFFKFSLGILLFDIDHFKKFNDTYGHLAGDAVLSSLGKIVRKNLRPGDLALRYGGEEFLIAIARSSEYAICAVGERLRKIVAAAPVIYQKQNLAVTISLGATVSGRKNCSISQLIQRADEALYVSKNNGRNRLTFLPYPG